MLIYKRSVAVELIWSALLVVTVMGCQPDDPICDNPLNSRCPNFDPCVEYPAASSDFEFLVRLTNPLAVDTLFEVAVDTSYWAENAEFVAQTNDLEYFWQVGTDPTVHSGKELQINFTGYEGDVEVTLTTFADSVSSCLEDHERRDEKSKTIHFVSGSRFSPILGTFVGKLIGQTDDREYTVEISEENPPVPRLKGLPLPNDCDFHDRGIPVDNGYQFLVSMFVQVDRSRRCRNLSVSGRLDLENTDMLLIEYQFDDDSGKRVSRIFEGWRQ